MREHLSVIVLLLATCIVPLFGNSSADVNLFTAEEQAYIANSGLISAASGSEAAPHSYRGKKGEPAGIFYDVLQLIQSKTGLRFSYQLYDSTSELLNSDPTLIVGLFSTIVAPSIELSVPFLTTDTLLFINRHLTADDLSGKIFSTYEGGSLPQGVEASLARFYSSREKSITAVEKGEADYGYSNAYSLAYYTLRNGYKNLVTIPQPIETRYYCIGVKSGEQLLLSIINKAIGAIDSKEMQALILSSASKVEPTVTVSMIMGQYGIQIGLLILLISVVLLLSVISTFKANKRLRKQNETYQALSDLSNEYLFDYDPKSEVLFLSQKSTLLFGRQLNRARTIIKDALAHPNPQEDVVKLPLPDRWGSFSLIRFNTSEKTIGKLVDVSKQVSEKEELLHRVQFDGLTGLYNYMTAKQLIDRHLAQHKAADAFILLDCDEFKLINDTHGHLHGNLILQTVAATLRSCFRSSDIIGRMGGDEFCIYFTNAPSQEYVALKCSEINNKIPQDKGMAFISVSIGFTMVKPDDSFESLFKRTDRALYSAKQRGKAHVVLA